MRIEQIRKGYTSALPFLEPSNPEREVAARLSKIEQGIREQQPQPAKNGPEQKIVNLEEMEESIGFGWRFVHALADGRYIISRN